MKLALLLTILFCGTTAIAQDALVVAASADRLREGNGGGVAALWIHPRGNDTFVAGASFLSLPGTRWMYGTFGDTRRVNARTTVNAEGNVGGGSDERGNFRYLLLRGGLTRELIANRLYAEAEWLQVDVARQQDGILRVGGSWTARPQLTLRASVYESLFGDSSTSLATLRGDYVVGHITVIAGATGGSATPALLQQADTRGSRVREAFGGVAFDAASRRWTVIASTMSVSGERRHRLSVSCRLPLPSRGVR